MGKRGKTRVRGNINDFFGSTTWAEIIKRLEGTNPLVFVIMKKDGSAVHNIMIKDGANFQNLGPEEINGLASKEVEPNVRKNIDAAFIPARIQGIEPPAEELPPIEEPKPVVPEKPVEKVPEPEPVPASDPEVDLQIGMRIAYLNEDKVEEEVEIVGLFEEEGQLLVARSGTRKKVIIDAEQIRRIV